MTQMAVAEHVGPWGEPLVSLALVLFATTTIAYNSFWVRTASPTSSDWGREPSWFSGGCADYDCVGFGSGSRHGVRLRRSHHGATGAHELLALWALYPVAQSLLAHFETQVDAGQLPRFSRDQLPRETLDPASWPQHLSD